MELTVMTVGGAMWCNCIGHCNLCNGYIKNTHLQWFYCSALPTLHCNEVFDHHSHSCTGMKTPASAAIRTWRFNSARFSFRSFNGFQRLTAAL